MTSLWELFLLLGASAGFLLFLYSVKHWPTVVALATSINVIVAWEVPHPIALATVNGISVYFLDVLSVATLTVAMTQTPALTRALGAAFWPWIGLGVLLIVSLAVGLAENALGTTMNEFRSFLYPYALTSWALSLEWTMPRTKALILRLSVILGWLLTVVAAYHFALYGLGSTSAFVDSGTGLEQTTRPLVSGQALLTLLCGMVCIWIWRESRRTWFLVSALTFFSVVAISQQRTVWAVGVVSLFVVFLAARAGTKLWIIAFGLATALFTSAALLGQIAPQLLDQLTTAMSDSGTYDARVRSWRNLVAESVEEGPAAVLFGQPMGDGFGRFEGAGRWVVFAPHNWYVTLYLRVGLAGLCCFLLFLTFIFIEMLRRRSSMVALGITSALIVYGWSYSWLWYAGIFFGWAIAYRGRAEQPFPEESSASSFGLAPNRTATIKHYGK